MTTLEQLADLVADVVLEQAAGLSVALMGELRPTRGVNPEFESVVFKSFALMNASIAAGVWSNLSNIALRRDLVSATNLAVALRIAQRHARPASAQEEVAAEAARIATGDIPAYTKAFIARARQLEADGMRVDGRMAVLFGLEWLQEATGLNSAFLDRATPRILGNMQFVDAIESVASTVNTAVSSPESFLSRMFRRFVRPR